MTLKDRVPTHANRKKITPESGESFYATVEYADEPIEEGTPVNKATLLSIGISDLTHAISSGGSGGSSGGASSKKHLLTGDIPSSGLATIRFKATASYAEGGTFSINGVTYTAKPNGEETALPDKAFVTGDVVSAEIDTSGHTINFKLGGGKSISIINFPLSIQLTQPTPQAVGHIWVKSNKADQINNVYIDDAMRLTYSNGSLLLRTDDSQRPGMTLVEEKKIQGKTNGKGQVQIAMRDSELSNMDWQAGYNDGVSQLKYSYPKVYSKLSDIIDMEDGYVWTGTEWRQISSNGRYLFTEKNTTSSSYSGQLYNVISDTEYSQHSADVSSISYFYDTNFTEDGKWLYSRDNLFFRNGDIFTKQTLPSRTGQYPCFSPDGTHCAIYEYSSNGTFNVFSLSSSTLTPITTITPKYSNSTSFDYFKAVYAFGHQYFVVVGYKSGSIPEIQIYDCNNNYSQILNTSFRMGGNGKPTFIYPFIESSNMYFLIGTDSGCALLYFNGSAVTVEKNDISNFDNYYPSPRGLYSSGTPAKPKSSSDGKYIFLCNASSRYVDVIKREGTTFTVVSGTKKYCYDFDIDANDNIYIVAPKNGGTSVSNTNNQINMYHLSNDTLTLVHEKIVDSTSTFAGVAVCPTN